MPLGIEAFTIGVEEEYQIVDNKTRKLAQRQQPLMSLAERTLGKDVQPELQLSQIEIATPVCSTLAEVRRALLRARLEIINAAKAWECRICAAGTHPFSIWSDQPITPKTRYRGIARDFQQVARESVIFGFHVHIGIADREDAIGVMNRVRTRLSPLLALAANSPFWLGDDTGYASFRTELWSRWPMSGPPLFFKSIAEYEALVRSLIDVGIIEDETKIYWDVRLSGRFPTLEFRVTDVCMTVDEAVMVTGLMRALARTEYLAHVNQTPLEKPRPELLRAAHWRAARFGIEGELVDVQAQRKVAAPELIEGLTTYVREALEEAGDFDEVSRLVGDTLKSGNGAVRQRAVLKRRRDFKDVVDYIVEQTEKG